MEPLRRVNDQAEYTAAFDRLRVAKNWIWLLLLLALLINIGLAVTVRYWPVLDESDRFQTELVRLRSERRIETSGALEPPVPSAPDEADEAAPDGPGSAGTVPADEDLADSMAVTLPAEPATQPAEDTTHEQADEPAIQAGQHNPDTSMGDVLYGSFGLVLAICQSVGVALSFLLATILTLNLLVSLAGRIGGAEGLTRALIWSVIFAALFVPWNLAFHGLPLPGVLFGRPELIAGCASVTWNPPAVGWEDHTLFVARFFAYPLAALVVLVAMQWNYAKAVRREPEEQATQPNY